MPFVALATVAAFVDGASRTLTVLGTIQETSAGFASGAGAGAGSGAGAGGGGGGPEAQLQSPAASEAAAMPRTSRKNLRGIPGS